MNPHWEELLVEKLQGMADDELILGHRNSEWTGHAPILEEDIAFANIAQDEIGHATIWYELNQQLSGCDPDKLVYFRGPSEYRNAMLVELPKGDWAWTMVRQYLFDAWEAVHLQGLSTSSYRPLAEAARKVAKEETYHVRHTETWMRRLGLGTEEAHRRTQIALEALWPYAQQLFCRGSREQILVEEEIIPAYSLLGSAWMERVQPFLKQCELTVPKAEPVRATRRDHTEHLPALLAELQQVARMDPNATW